MVTEWDTVVEASLKAVPMWTFHVSDNSSTYLIRHLEFVNAKSMCVGEVALPNHEVDRPKFWLRLVTDQITNASPTIDYMPMAAIYGEMD